MRESIFIKTDYSLLKSVIKIPELLSYAKENNITTLGIIDDNLSSSAEFLDGCIKNGIKPVIDKIMNNRDKTLNDDLSSFIKFHVTIN